MAGRDRPRARDDEPYRDDADDDEHAQLLLDSEARSSAPPRPQRRSRAWRFCLPFSRSASRQTQQTGRTIALGQGDTSGKRHTPNIIRNQKYSLVTFFPLVLYEQFKFFFNLYFLLVALSQFLPPLKIGFLATYIAPLSFVLAITIGKEALDDYQRYKRDQDSNAAPFEVLLPSPSAAGRGYDEEARPAASSHHRTTIPSSKIKVGDFVVLHKNQRVPADMVLLKTWAGDQLPEREPAAKRDSRGDDERDHRFVLDDDEEEGESDDGQAADDAARERVEDPSAGGSCFIRTDQLDGETDCECAPSKLFEQSLTSVLYASHPQGSYASP